MREALLKRICAANFVMVETRLYLDTHKDDKDAIELFEKYSAKHKALVKEYEKEFGPLSLNGKNSDEWLQNPWPWDNTFEVK